MAVGAVSVAYLNLRPIEAWLLADDGGMKMEDGCGDGGFRDHDAPRWLWEQCRI